MEVHVNVREDPSEGDCTDAITSTSGDSSAEICTCALDISLIAVCEVFDKLGFGITIFTRLEAKISLVSYSLSTHNWAVLTRFFYFFFNVKEEKKII